MTLRPSIGEFDFQDASLRIVEAAIRNEETISTPARELRELKHQFGEQVRTPPNWTADQVDRRLEATIHNTATHISAQLTDANNAAKQAQAQYQHAANFSVKRIAWIASGYFAFGCVGMIIGIYISAQVILPAPDVLQRERQAEATVAELAAHGGDSILSYCNTDKGQKRCIRTEERGLDAGQRWGTTGDTYQPIYGY